MALALYRKYRPATFAEVVGQEHVTGPLMTAVDSGRINHAYLFSGPRGCGKTSSARILARSLNCEQGPTSTPCGQCQSCIDLAPDGPGNIDVIEIDAASHGGVDDARDLRERAFQLPVQNRYKIYIIDEAHMVSNQGFNALLKVVEEPPESVIFIFATTEPDKVLPTIRSRTHHYPFRLVPPATMRDLLERNCRSEGVTVGQAVLPLVVRAGGGSVRDSQSLLDQLIAGAGPDGITYEDALALLGVTDAALLDDMVEAIGVADGATVFGTVDRLVDAGHDPRRFAADLLDRLRDLILMAAVPDAGKKGLIDAPEDHLEKFAGQANRLGLTTLSRLADIVHVGLTEMRGTTAPRLGLELICARMLLPAVSTDAAALTQRMERLERRMEIGGVPTDAAGASHPRTDRRVAPADGMTPRQRAEARYAAQRGAPPPSQQRPTPGENAEPAADATPAQPQVSSAAQPTPASPEAPPKPSPSEAPVAKRVLSEETSPSAPTEASPAPVEDGGWPEVRAPGSGRGAAPSTPVVPEPPKRSTQPADGPTPAAPSPAQVRQPPAPKPPAAAEPVEPQPAEAPAPASASNSSSSDFDIAEIRRQWRGVVDHIKRTSRAGAALVETATPVAVRADTLVLTAPPALVRRLSDQQRPLAAALQQVLGVSWAIEVTDQASAQQAGQAAPAASGAAQAEDDEEDGDPYDESVEDPRASLDPGEAAMNLLRDELGAEEINES
ncbi:DNA polymerase III subunit gamma and tau [Blastococcus sp. Marseille-P5729]|uniref:DNA polymerase III subunit gamma and tau n=1 Tax=Blastococcus sp. Marseille-P5729 TaxID=2086582 RepID=UPI000D10645D|nr:DNA polymerase III subunit gamma and tau [Blastococcus sp. Marseille-P5729]